MKRRARSQARGRWAMRLRGRAGRGRSRRLSLEWAAAALLLFGGCVDLTPPWDKAVKPEAGVGLGGAAGGGATGTGGGGGSGGRDAFPSIDAPAQGGAGGDADVPATILDGSAAGGATGSLDSPLVGTEAGRPEGRDGGVASTGGAGGVTIDADIDAPMGGAGGAGWDGSLDGDVGGRGGAGGGQGTGGRGTGGSGTGGRGTGGSGTGGRGTGGAGTGGATGTGGAGTGGATGSGGATSSGGTTGVVMAGLVAYYPCDQTAGPTLTDLSGNGRHATLVTGTGGSGGYTFGTGKVKSALYLVKNSQGHVTIPQGVLSGATEMTIATWVYLNSAADWQRVWDFGIDTNQYMFVSPRSSVTGFLRFGISLNGYGNEQGLNGTAELPITQWKHVAVVIGSGGGLLYLDGAQIAANAAITLPPELGNTPNNFIGKSQFAGEPEPDPYLDGNIDDFRVYNRALSATEVLTLFNWTGS